jgi:hypothetical protein
MPVRAAWLPVTWASPIALPSSVALPAAVCVPSTGLSPAGAEVRTRTSVEACASTASTKRGSAVLPETLRKFSAAITRVPPGRSSSSTIRLNSAASPGSRVRWFTVARSAAPQVPGLDASRRRLPVAVASVIVAVLPARSTTGLNTRMMIASVPPCWKKWATAWLIVLSCQRPPKPRS